MTLRLLTTRSCWIFDLDGTLTRPVHDFAWIRRELDIPGTADILEHLETLPADEAAWRHDRLDAIERELAHKAEAAPGAVAWVRQLHREGARVGILTRNSREIALLTLEVIGLRPCFDEQHVLGRDDAPPKPHPGGIIHLLDAWRAVPGDAVMVGDYLFDLQAGRAAGTLTMQVGRPDGKRWPEMADLLVASLEELDGMRDQP